MLLATTAVEDYDRFVEVFSTKGAEKRKQHGSQGATVFRDPSQADRVWVVFDWDAEGGRASSPTPRSPESCRRPATRGSRRRTSTAATTRRNATSGLTHACVRR